MNLCGTVVKVQNTMKDLEKALHISHKKLNNQVSQAQNNDENVKDQFWPCQTVFLVEGNYIDERWVYKYKGQATCCS